MNSTIQAVLSIVARVMLATIFLMSALGKKIPDFAGTVEYMKAHQVPAPSVLLVGAIAFLLVGSVTVVLGYKARLGAGLLFVFLVLATYYFHNFWSYPPDSQDFQMQMIQFMKNLGLMGAMLMIMVNGPGAGSLDARKRQAEEGRVSLGA